MELFLLNENKNNFTDLNGWCIDHTNDKKQNAENYKSPLFFISKRILKFFRYQN
jgi:hypothetical protein